MKQSQIMGIGGPLTRWQYKSCKAEVEIGKDWATVYSIESKDEGKGHATKLLLAMKKYYENKGLRFGGSIALNERMAWIYKKCGVTEYH